MTKTETERLEKMIIELMVTKGEERKRIEAEVKERKAALNDALYVLEEFDRDVSTLAKTLEQVRTVKDSGKSTPFKKHEKAKPVASKKEPERVRHGPANLFVDCVQECFLLLKKNCEGTSVMFRPLVKKYHVDASEAYVKSLGSWYMGYLKEQGRVEPTDEKFTFKAKLVPFEKDCDGNAVLPPPLPSEVEKRQKRV